MNSNPYFAIPARAGLSLPWLLATAAILLVSCTGVVQPGATKSGANTASASAETADEFIARVNRELQEIYVEQARLAWVRATYITVDTNALAAKSQEKALAFNSRIIEESKRYSESDYPGTTGRAIKLIKLGSTLPAPDDADKRAELSQIMVDMSSLYGTGNYCPDGKDSCRNIEQLSQVLADAEDYDAMVEAWQGWRTIAPPMRDKYRRFVELANEGARELGFTDTGALWRSGYDLDADAFEQEAERLWNQVKPLYEELHCYVRDELADHYGEDKVSRTGPIPAHLLGNMWSQTWGNVYDMVEPYEGVADLDVTSALVDQDYDAVKMVNRAEGFFTSLGLPDLPASFYERSMLTRPQDREVVCHASAWPIDGKEDVRIKMCIQQTEEDLTTIYHELGHIYYFLMYQDQPPLFQGGAHDGFHEAIGDTIVLSMTPDYMKSIGLVGEVERSEKAVINQQMKMALEKIAFLPFGKLVDQWRWDVFAGKTAPEEYNAAWWELRTRYQGIAPPVARSEANFDPGAKYHVPANTPYTRYFLSFVIQFQFHRALCEAAGFDGPLHECSIYDSKVAGKRFGDMLALGQSQPWPDALEKLAGTREMDASAIIDYFAPLMGWLKERNQGKTCGWEG